MGLNTDSSAVGYYAMIQYLLSKMNIIQYYKLALPHTEISCIPLFNLNAAFAELSR